MLIINDEVSKNNARYLFDRGVSIPTYSQMKNPKSLTPLIKNKLKNINYDTSYPLNLYRITWKNAPNKNGGGFQHLPNYIEFPTSITGVDARIVGISGKFFPTGSHKIGSSLACLIPKVISGAFDLQSCAAIWPSTGNFCRGGAFSSEIMGCNSIAILPENMSRERYDWLGKIAGEIIKTEGSETNIKNIFDKANQLMRERKNVSLFNQFSNFWNYLWHYEVTSDAITELYEALRGNSGRFAGICLSSGSAGSLGCADSIKKSYPLVKLAVGEALQCPTLLMNGYGSHSIEGIGDMHVPWIHNVKNTDIVIGIDDRDTMSIFQLFIQAAGKEYLTSKGVPDDVVKKLNWCGLSGIANLCMTIKFAKYYELSSQDIVFTILPDSADMYMSRLENETTLTSYSPADAQIAHHTSLLSQKTDNIHELTYRDKKRIHNLKYYTWVEQQGMDEEELTRQWYDPSYWDSLYSQIPLIDEAITNFNV